MPVTFRARGTSISRSSWRSTPEQIRDRLGPPEAAELVTYCHSGSRSDLAAQILGAAGYVARNYRGSWHEWSRDASLPAETGPET